jgi:anti-sigma B factor antagonist
VTCGSVHRTSSDGPSSWKVTEVADLRGDRLLVLQGELDMVTAPELKAMLQRLRRQDHAVTLDLSAVTFMDSTGLSVLIRACTDARGNGSLALRHPSPAVWRVFTLAGVTELLDQ